MVLLVLVLLGTRCNYTKQWHCVHVIVWVRVVLWHALVCTCEWHLPHSEHTSTLPALHEAASALQIKALNLSMHGHACMHLQLLGPGTSGTRWVHGAPHLALHLRQIRPIPATCTSVKAGVGGELCPGNAGGGTGRRNGREAPRE